MISPTVHATMAQLKRRMATSFPVVMRLSKISHVAMLAITVCQTTLVSMTRVSYSLVDAILRSHPFLLAGNAYIAGCTDPLYVEAGCPFKSNDFNNQEWVGIIMCEAHKDESEAVRDWSGCKVPDGATDLERLPPCDCHDKAVLFKGEKVLSRRAILPKSAGGVISWVPGNKPGETASTTGIVSSGISSPSIPATTTSLLGTSSASQASDLNTVPSPTQVPTSQEGSGLSSGTTAGIAAGSAGGILLIAAVVLLSCLLQRQRKKKRLGYSQPPGGILTSENQPQSPPPPFHPGYSPIPANTQATVFKSELPADNISPASPPYTSSPEFKGQPYATQHQTGNSIGYADSWHSTMAAGLSPSAASGYNSHFSSATMGENPGARNVSLLSTEDSGPVKQKPAAELQG